MHRELAKKSLVRPYGENIGQLDVGLEDYERTSSHPSLEEEVGQSEQSV